jgi:hypothetical protein
MFLTVYEGTTCFSSLSGLFIGCGFADRIQKTLPIHTRLSCHSGGFAGPRVVPSIMREAGCRPLCGDHLGRPLTSHPLAPLIPGLLGNELPVAGSNGGWSIALTADAAQMMPRQVL